MSSPHAGRAMGDSLAGASIHCEHRKAGRERLIRRTSGHRGRSVDLDHATCVIERPYAHDDAFAHDTPRSGA